MLELTNVTAIYPDKTKVIDSVSFTLKEGECIALVGENGAGKTSLLHAILGILDIPIGEITVEGIKLSKKTEQQIRQKIGIVFQNPDDQLFMPTVYEDIAFGPRSMGLTEPETEIKVNETLKILNISHLYMRSSLRLSGGEKRMAAIATVLAMQPSILCFDEPTAFLDTKAKRILLEILLKLPHPKIIASHDLPFISQICNRVLILKDGRLVADTDPSILNDSKLLEEYGL
ncbi:MAG: energy-coupling factor ABC transporter ATP-binding protein [Oscillospiraceae bacterium]|nr:energy-coupling factor ABC transporter ATP-binding protein [Oscillospiraceae bacterium]